MINMLSIHMANVFEKQGGQMINMLSIHMANVSEKQGDR